MIGRVRGLLVSTTALVVAPPSPDRTELIFSAGNTAGTGSVVLKDGDEDATTTNGFPLSQSCGPVRFEGQIARKRWTAIRLVATDTVVGICEGYPDNYAVPPQESGVPT